MVSLTRLCLQHPSAATLVLAQSAEQNASTEDRDDSHSQCKDFPWCARIGDVVEHPHRVDHDRDKLVDSGRLDCPSCVELLSEWPVSDQKLGLKLKAASVQTPAANQIPHLVEFQGFVTVRRP